MQHKEIQYQELTEAMINEDVASDINHLLPQLTSHATKRSEESIRRVVASETRIFAAWDEGCIVGVVLFCSAHTLLSRKNWIEELVVDEAYQGQGIASHLLETVESAIKKSGGKDANLTSNRKRTGARALYLKRGYEIRDADLFRKTF